MPKSAFVSAQAETVTFIYPQPLDQPDPDSGEKTRERLIDPEVLRDESGGEISEQERPWIKLKIPRSADLVDKVADLTQPALLVATNGDDSAAETRIARMNKGLFELLVEGWSFSDGKPEIRLYNRLDTWSAVWVRNCLGEANRRGTTVDFQKLDPSSSPSVESSPEESHPSKRTRS